ncbi:MAG: hypothetical protein MHPSP_000281, partial [Paramarteilia canceri]
AIEELKLAGYTSLDYEHELSQISIVGSVDGNTAIIFKPDGILNQTLGYSKLQTISKQAIEDIRRLDNVKNNILTARAVYSIYIVYFG